MILPTASLSPYMDITRCLLQLILEKPQNEVRRFPLSLLQSIPIIVASAPLPFPSSTEINLGLSLLEFTFSAQSSSRVKSVLEGHVLPALHSVVQDNPRFRAMGMDLQVLPSSWVIGPPDAHRK